MVLQIRHTMIITSGVPCSTIDSPRGLWGRGWTTCLLYDGPVLGLGFKCQLVCELLTARTISECFFAWLNGLYFRCSFLICIETNGNHVHWRKYVPLDWKSIDRFWIFGLGKNTSQKQTDGNKQNVCSTWSPLYSDKYFIWFISLISPFRWNMFHHRNI